MTRAPAWLAARPVAHRGLHDRGSGTLENTLGAARAAIERGFAIECDVQVTADGDAVVFHDFDLDRLTTGTGPVAGRTSAQLLGLGYAIGTDHIATLEALLSLVAGRVPLICEIKSRFDGDLRLTRRVGEIVARYAGPVAVKSFDPSLIAALQLDAPCPLGIVAEAVYDHPEWASLSEHRKRHLAEFLHFADTRPDFVSYAVDDLPHAVPHLLRVAVGCPVLAWTVRTPAQRAVAARWADQIVFEGFEP